MRATFFGPGKQTIGAHDGEGGGCCFPALLPLPTAHCFPFPRQYSLYETRSFRWQILQTLQTLHRHVNLPPATCHAMPSAICHLQPATSNHTLVPNSTTITTSFCSPVGNAASWFDKHRHRCRHVQPPSPGQDQANAVPRAPTEEIIHTASITAPISFAVRSGGADGIFSLQQGCLFVAPSLHQSPERPNLRPCRPHVKPPQIQTCQVCKVACHAACDGVLQMHDARLQGQPAQLPRCVCSGRLDVRYAYTTKFQASSLPIGDPHPYHLIPRRSAEHDSRPWPPRGTWSEYLARMCTQETHHERLL